MAHATARSTIAATEYLEIYLVNTFGHANSVAKNMSGDQRNQVLTAYIRISPGELISILCTRAILASKNG